MKNKTRSLLKNLKQNACIVLGLSSLTGLSIIRSLGAKKIPVIGIDNSKFTLGAFSKYCSSVEVVNNDSALLSLLEEIGKLSLNKNVIFCESDKYLLFVEKNKDSLEKYFYLSLPQKYSLQQIVNKSSMIKIAKEAGLDIPLTFSSQENSLDEIRTKIKYPSIIKPLYTQINYNTKGEIINNEQGLYKAMKKDRFREGYIVQEVVEGLEESIWVCSGYYNKNNIPLALFTGHKYRQVPNFFGTTTLAVSQENKTVAMETMTLLKHVRYHGCFDVEFKQSRDKIYTFIEINPRMCFWNEMILSSGINLPYIAYCDAVGLPNQKDLKQKNGILWISIIDDFITCVKYYTKNNKLILFDWAMKTLRADSYAVFRLADIKPFIFKIIWHLIRMFRKNILYKYDITA